jgi:hypothetical protein
MALSYSLARNASLMGAAEFAGACENREKGRARRAIERQKIRVKVIEDVGKLVFRSIRILHSLRKR